MFKDHGLGPSAQCIDNFSLAKTRGEENDFRLGCRGNIVDQFEPVPIGQAHVQDY